MATRERLYPTTGFWLFICNTNFWNGDAWLAFGESELLYKISKHHAYEIKPGQPGLLRFNKDVRSHRRRSGRPPHPAGIYAVVEVAGTPSICVDPDVRAYNSPDDAHKPSWRVPLRILANLNTAPVLASSLPQTEEFKHIHLPLNTSSLAIKETAFEYVLSKASVVLPGAHEELDSDAQRLAESPSGVFDLERHLANATPKQKARVSHYIERGSVGRWVKNQRGGRCQICDALGAEPVAFVDRKGRPFSEAHHVIPVSSLIAGSLSYLNIMVLCPNHHRQAHFGSFDVLENDSDAWLLEVGGQQLRIEKPSVPSKI